jgi:hypothetical protein
VLEGHPGRADAVFAHTYDLATDYGAMPVAALILAERFLLAAEREDWLAADALLERAWKSWRSGASTATGPALSSSQPRRGPLHTVDTCMQRAITSSALPGCDRC